MVTEHTGWSMAAWTSVKRAGRSLRIPLSTSITPPLSTVSIVPAVRARYASRLIPLRVVTVDRSTIIVPLEVILSCFD